VQGVKASLGDQNSSQYRRWPDAPSMREPNRPSKRLDRAFWQQCRHRDALNLDLRAFRHFEIEKRVADLRSVIERCSFWRFCCGRISST
jgi:hypothetical protein